MPHLSLPLTPAAGGRLLERSQSALCFLIPPVACYAHLGLAPAAVLAVLVFWIPEVVARKRFIGPSSGWTVLIGLFLGWAAVTMLWTIDLRLGIEKFAQVAGMTLLAALALSTASGLPEYRRHACAAWFRTGFLAAMVLVLADLATDGNVYRSLKGTEGRDLIHLKPAAAALAVMIWPAHLAWIRAGSAHWGWLQLGLVLAIVAWIGAYTAFAALLAGLGLFIVGSRHHAWAAKALIAGFCLVLVAAPVVTRHVPDLPTLKREWGWLPDSFHHRLLIGRFASDLIAEKPVLGWGLNSARVIPGGSEDQLFLFVDHDGSFYHRLYDGLMPLHPHNGALHWALELGLPGLALLAVFVIMTVRQAGNLPSSKGRAAFLAALGCIWLIWLQSYGAFQSWWLGAQWITVFLILAFLPARGPSDSTERP